jgi:hypothetical protein
MKTKTTIITTLLAWTVALPMQAHESKHKLEYPGFRPPTEQADVFIQNVESSKIAVFPSIVRVVNPAEDKVSQWHSKVALGRIVEFLGENGLGTAEITDTEFKIGEAPKGGQFAVFNQTIETTGGQIDSYTGDANYILVLDIIRVRTRAWGIQCYILDRKGENVFSFLLNSHHKPFVDAAIQMKDDSKESSRMLVAEFTELALESLHQQVHMEQDIAAYKPDPAIAGKYSGKEDPATNYLILKADGSFEVADDGRNGEGTYAIVGGSTLVLIKDGQRHPVGRFENGKLITNEGEILTRSDDR